MSLQVQSLTKLYGTQRAVDAVSFSLNKGELVGFLGPNGAGKSTTMKIMTGYLRPSGGSIVIDGFNILEKPLEAKKVMGYLPENNPLYLDMYVKEYLHFVGRLYGIKRTQRKYRVAETIDRWGLKDEQNKKLRALSKGYRQRVGLAQALIHNPGILILDEPTTGLDPNQIVEIRRMIKEISRDKTVLFSTHIMQEVQALCDRVIVIDKGKIVADDCIDALVRGDNRAGAIVVQFREQVDKEELSRITGVDEVVQISRHRFKLFPGSGIDLRDELSRCAKERGYTLIELREEEGGMENIFQQLTSPTRYD